MPAVQKGTQLPSYYNAVSASDEAFGLFLFPYYKPTLGNKKSVDTVEEAEGKKLI